MRHFIDYIVCVRESMKRYPREENWSKYMYVRNHMYMYSQPHYLYGRIIDKLIRLTDNVYNKYKSIKGGLSLSH